MKIEIVNNLNDDENKKVNEDDNFKIGDEFKDSDDEYDDEYDDELEDAEELNFEPKELINILDDDFSAIIKERGQDYYLNNHVLQVYKNNNLLFCKVLGRENKEYMVFINMENDIKCNCSCPCDYPCKHIYASLIAISNLEYKEICLLPEINKEKKSLEELFEKINGDELKEYLKCNVKSDDLVFDKEDFDKYFYKYLPEQKYEYYYNKLHNSVTLDNTSALNEFLEEINLCINVGKFEEAFKIFRFIVAVYTNLDKLGDYNLIRNMPILKMYLNIIYSNSDKNLLELIYSWLKYLEQNNYYNNSYLKYLVNNFK